MTIDEAVKFIDAQARKNQVGNITIAQKNSYFKRAQLEIVNDLKGNIEDYQPGRPVPLKAFEMTSTMSDDLSPLIQSLDITQIVSGKAIRPIDYMYFIPPLQADYYENPNCGEDAYQAWVPIDFVTHGEKALRLISQIDYPDAFSPIAVNYSGFFQIYPETIQKVRLTYLRKPKDPVWGYTVVNSSPVYDPTTSQDFELPEQVHTKICEKVLEYYGISTRDVELLSATEQKLKSGT